MGGLGLGEIELALEQCIGSFNSIKYIGTDILHYIAYIVQAVILNTSVRIYNAPYK